MLSDLVDVGAALLPGSGWSLQFHTLLFGLLFAVLLLLLATFATGQRHGAAIRTTLLLLFSGWFLLHASGWLILLLLLTSTIDWLLARHLARQPEGWQRDWPLYLGVALNLGALGTFKYANFLGSSFLGEAWHPFLWLAPLGMSFYTFRSLSYLLDVHREMTEPEPNLPRYWLYVGCFAHLPAGPITRSEGFLAQLREPFQPTGATTAEGLYRFVLGLCKKLIIADYLAANLVNRVFEAPGAFSGLEVLMGVLGYGVQLYYDFSGYMDMAIGLALLCGLRLPENFRQPFHARSVTDFWRRWHLTLSAWFNDYVFTPLSFRLRQWGRWGLVLAVVFTFTLSGLWHGAAWAFVLWGLLHGLAIGLETATVNQRRAVQARLGGVWAALGWVATMIFLLATFVLFRAADLTLAATIYQRIGSTLDLSLVLQWLALYPRPALVLGIAIAIHYVPTSAKQRLQAGFGRLPWPAQAAAGALGIAAAYQAYTADMQPFVYLQF